VLVLGTHLAVTQNHQFFNGLGLRRAQGAWLKEEGERGSMAEFFFERGRDENPDKVAWGL